MDHVRAITEFEIRQRALVDHERAINEFEIRQRYDHLRTAVDLNS